KGHRLLWVTFSSNRDYGLHVNNLTGGFVNCMPANGPAHQYVPNIVEIGADGKNLITQCRQPQIWMGAVLIDAAPPGCGRELISARRLWDPRSTLWGQIVNGPWRNRADDA